MIATLDRETASEWIWLITFPAAMFTLVFALAILEVRVLAQGERTDTDGCS